MKKVRQLRTVVRMKDLVRHRKSEIDAEWERVLEQEIWNEIEWEKDINRVRKWYKEF